MAEGQEGVTAQCNPGLAADELASWHCKRRTTVSVSGMDGRSEPLFISSMLNLAPPTRGSDPTDLSSHSTDEQRGACGKLGCRWWC